MMNEWLKKIGVNSFSDLNEEEKSTYREYEEALSGRKITDKDYREFLEMELDIAVTKATDEGLSDKVRDFRSCEVRIIKKIIGFINAPLVEKQFAEQSMKQLIKK